MSKLDPTALTVTEAAQLLTAAGAGEVTSDQIEADIAAGAPVGSDGRINLLHYAAWLNRELDPPLPSDPN